MVNNQRIINIDIIRGIALLGIFIAHSLFWFSAATLPYSIITNSDSLSKIIIWLCDFFISGKFFAIFSFLFGVSFFLFTKKNITKDNTFNMRFIWRNIILGLIGLTHNLFWNGDILIIYSILSFFLFAIRSLNNKTILSLGLLLAFNIPGILIEGFKFYFQKNASLNSIVSYPDYTIPSYVNLKELLIFNWKYWPDKIHGQLNSGRIFITFGFMLLGLYVGRKELLINVHLSIKIINRIFFYSGILVLVISVINHYANIYNYGISYFIKNAAEKDNLNNYFFGIHEYFRNALLVFFYLTGLIKLLDVPFWQKKMFFFSNIGKIALTTYLSQTFLGLIVFYHLGFGLFLKTTPWMNCLIAMVLFFLQFLACNFWLKKFNYGPIEWLWRSLTYFKWQSILK